MDVNICICPYNIAAAPFLEVFYMYGYLPRGKPQCGSVMIEAIDPFKLCCGCAYVEAVLATLPLFLSSQELLEVFYKYGYFRRDKPQCSAVIQAIDTFKWAHTSESTTYKLFLSLFMLWVLLYSCPYNVTAALVGLALGSFLHIWLPPEGQTTVW